MQDYSSGRFQRFTPAAYLLIGLMDGKRTVQEIWDTAVSHLGEDAPTQDEVVRLLGQLHAVDALQSDILPDTGELLRRFERMRYGKWKQRLRSPLFVRVPLFDPDRFLNRFQWLARPFLSWPGTILWLVMVGMGISLVGVHWPELTENITDRILAPKNLVILWLTFPFLKFFHEFGHAFAVKIRGGEIHEMGIMFLVFTPIPYVDASAASAFREKRERILVGAAGMLVEVFFAALALLVWVNIEPGPIRSVSYNVIFIAGVSSLLFNGNPLLRYDAYYILVDILEIPNLGPRGNKYIFYQIRRYLFGMREEEPPLSTRGERIWFAVYSLSSFIYRIFIFAAILLFVATKFFFIGVLFACWGMLNMFILPAAKGVKFLITSPKLRRKRSQAIMVAGMVFAGVLALITLVPVPLNTRAEGTIWMPDRSFVRAATDGFVDRIVATPGTRIGQGDPLVACSDPLLPAQLKILKSRLRELQAIYDTHVISDRVKAEITKKEIQHVEAQLQDAQERTDELIIRSASSGIFIVPIPQDLPGRFVRRGELLGYVLDRSEIIARVAVNQKDIDFVRFRTHGVNVRFPERIVETYPAMLKREVPAATDQLPSRVLSQEGGGKIAIDPRDMRGIKAFQKVFLFDIEIPSYGGLCNVGGRIYVRFNHGWEPLVRRWYRGLRRLFLRRFSV